MCKQTPPCDADLQSVAHGAIVDHESPGSSAALPPVIVAIRSDTAAPGTLDSRPCVVSDVAHVVRTEQGTADGAPTQ